MPRPECPREENIVRALRNTDFDIDKNRYSSTVFCGPNTSVSRLKIFPLSELFKIFHRDLDRPDKDPAAFVVAAGEINVGALQELGKNHNKPTIITVEVDSTDANPAHAEIPQALQRGLVFKILAALKIHKE